MPDEPIPLPTSEVVLKASDVCPYAGVGPDRESRANQTRPHLHTSLRILHIVNRVPIACCGFENLVPKRMGFVHRPPIVGCLFLAPCDSLQRPSNITNNKFRGVLGNHQRNETRVLELFLLHRTY
jgi:hypothetical protein